MICHLISDQPKKDSVKEQIEREFREIEECKKGRKKDRDNDKQKRVGRKFSNVSNELISSILTSITNIPLIQSGINKGFQNIARLNPYSTR